MLYRSVIWLGHNCTESMLYHSFLSFGQHNLEFLFQVPRGFFDSGITSCTCKATNYLSDRSSGTSSDAITFQTGRLWKLVNLVDLTKKFWWSPWNLSLRFILFHEKKTPNDAVTPQPQSQFTLKIKAKVVPRLLSSLVWIDQYNECNGMTSFMEFMKCTH